MKRMLLLGAPLMLAAGATVAVASARDAMADAKAAVQVAEKANKALAKRRAGEAVALAERAVSLAPNDAGHRALLGQAYLQAGRFSSARAALEEAVQLDGRDARAALNLVLAQIATGDWAAARHTLDTNSDKIATSDLGLAIALTGDPAGAVAVLTHAARQPGATAKTRQNLALVLALAGQWQSAKLVAATDTPADKLDQRMLEWAAFAQPRAASDQVAHLLGVQAVADPGRPMALALNAPAAPVAVAEPVAVAAVTPPAVAPAPVAAADAPGFSKVVFAPTKEVVQALPVATLRPVATPAKLALTVKPQALPAAKVVATRVAKPSVALPAKGQFYVQLGAFDSPAVARDAWGRAARRFSAFKAHTPTGMSFGRFYRLSVGGFSQADAASMCQRYRAVGGTCFVRAGAGDQVAQWVRKPGAQLAMR